MTTEIIWPAPTPPDPLPLPRRITSTSELEGQTITQAVDLWFPEGVLLRLGERYCKLTAKPDYDNSASLKFGTATASELRNIGLASQEDVDREQAATVRARETWERQQLERLRAKYEGGK